VEEQITCNSDVVGVGGAPGALYTAVNVVKITENLQRRIPKQIERLPVKLVEVGVIRALDD